VSYKEHFQRALSAAPGRLHFAAHSHHLWPDASFAAHVQAWLDAATFADQKWPMVMGELVPRAQGHIARRIGLGDGLADGASVAFAPNTHELVGRVLSCLPRGRPARVLTTSSEFHSFARQSERLEEAGELVVERVPTEPFSSFVERFAEAARRGEHDLVFFSHTFFDSGFVVPDLGAIVGAVPRPEALIVIDGYHAFMALPVALGPLAARVFYLAGGYKYAMSGEGVCFIHVPPGYAERPRNTGWYAAFGALERAQTRGVSYAPGGARFWGATFDPTALYRFDAVMRWLDQTGIEPGLIHAHAHRLQARFVAGLSGLPVSEADLVVPLSEANRGQFLAFRTPEASAIRERLLAAGVVTDARGDRLRLGFGIYLDEADVDLGLERMRHVLS
jgi:selenocysteine lyase/cysteine desulfurase